MIKRILLSLQTILLLISCASAPESYTPSATYSENDLQDITDEDIKKAFEAQPQIQLPAKLSWYNMGQDDFMKEYLYINHKNITLNYEIPKTLVEGYNPLPAGYGYYQIYEPVKLNIKALRLLSARAKCDILVLVATKFQEKRTVNWTTLFNILIIPVFFVPQNDVEYFYEAEVFIFDVRNGYMYKQIKMPVERKKDYISWYDLDAVKEAMQKEMKEEAGKYLRGEMDKLFEIK